MPGHIRLLHVFQSGYEKHETQHPDKGGKLRHIIKGSDKRRGEEHNQVEQRAHGDIEPEHAGKVQFIRVLFLNERVAHATVDKDLHDQHEDGDDCHRAVNRRIK